MTTPPPPPPGGRPLWQVLAALVLLPALAAAALGVVSVEGAARAADRAGAAARETASVARLDAVRRAVDSELLPALLLVTLHDEELAARTGFTTEERAALLGSQPARLAEARSATDAALAELTGAARGAGIDVASTTTDTSNRLTSVRVATSGPQPDVTAIADAYLRTSDGLARAQDRATARALAASTSTQTALALQDLRQVVRLGQLAGRQVPLLLASRVTSADDSGGDGGTGAAEARAWLAAWGSYDDLVGAGAVTDRSARGPALAVPALQRRWDAALADPAVVALSDLLDAQAVEPSAPVVQGSSFPALAVASASRDRVLAALLDTTAQEVARATADDARTAVLQVRLLAVAGALLLLVCLVAPLLLGRWLARSSAELAAAAERVTRGELEDVPEHGPRELRTASRALSAAVAALRLVQEQARLVVAGRHEEALRMPVLPGPLGRDVHAWTVQVARSARAREQLQERVAEQAALDPLTGLATRASVLATLERTLLADRAGGRRTGLLFVDLDGFKAVNDRHGHAAGDELLRVVGSRLREVARDADVVGRLGGDEFVVVVPGAPHVEALQRRAAAVVRAISAPVRLSGTAGAGAGTLVGASVGAALAPDPAASTGRAADQTTAGTLLAEADTAAYRAKAAGRGRVEVFDDALRAELAEHASTEHAVRAALALGQLHLVYQPVVAVGASATAADGALLGVEALMRWDRPGHGRVPTTDVVAVAERSALVRDLGRFALAEAALQLVRWTVAGLPVPSVAVNLSGRHLADPRVIPDVLEALETSGLEPGRLVLEITETVLVDDERVTQHLRVLRAHGVRVTIDDFGTGYTSIAALATTPADRLKVARELVVADDEARQQLLALTARAGRAFGLEVVALGVELPEHLERAAAAGCTGAQGWLVAGAVPAAQLPALLAETTAGTVAASA